MAESDPIGHVATVQALEPVAVAGIAGQNAKKLLGL